MARHDREDPHSLEDQLAWLDAIKEMPDEVEIAVSAVTSATLASPPPPAAEPDSPYPADPWSAVPAEPPSGGLLRAATDSATGAAAGTAYGAPSREGPEAFERSETAESSATRHIREADFGGYSGGFRYESGEKSGFGGAYGGDSGYGETAFGDTGFGDTAFLNRPEPSSTEEAEDTPVERSAASGPEALAQGTDFGSGRSTAGTAPGEPQEGSATSTGPVSAPPYETAYETSYESYETSFGQTRDRSAGSSFGASLDAGPEPSDATAEAPSGDREPDDDGPPTSPPGALGGASSYTTPRFAERGAGGGVSGSPADTDSYNVGAFSGSESATSYAPPASSEPYSPKESLRGWLEPAVPVPPMPEERAAEPEEPPAPSFGASRAEPVPDAKDDRFTGSLREDLAAEERKPYEPGPVAAPVPAGVPGPSLATDQAPPVDRDTVDRDRADRDIVNRDMVNRDAVAEREAYQTPRRPAPPTSAFSSPARTTGGKPAVSKPASSKPTADSLDPVTLLRGRRNTPTTGWRRLVYKASAGLIKPGEAPEVRRRRELVQRARTPVSTGHHRVAVLSLKGGVGKTTTTVGLGATLAQVRGDRVIAVDANPDRGTLSDKVELETAATVRDLLNERAQIKRYVDIRAFTSQTPSRLEILASDRDPSVSEAFSAKDYHAVAQVLENFYSICITDCGTGLLHSAMSGVLGMADQIVLVSSPSVDGARAASATLDWLEAHHYGDLVRAATVVLCSVRPRSKSTVDLDKLEAHFAARCRTVVRVPYDPHLEEGAEIDLDRLQEPTRDAYLRLAASVGDGFAGPQALNERRFSEIPDHL
ncbi:AAA family ATPase [Microbispora sp. H11081]|uniref:MinD/ParA family ATP-binding protein n=1 Tax=Microbispora sp. H11081 TaxID=2729107 RepID=UPI00289EB749|nr:AAA family ATPase [Microbispora sp. H11081]